MFDQLPFQSDDAGIADLLTYRASHDPDKTALILPDATISYGHLQQRAAAVSEQFKTLGYAGGDVIATYLPSGIDFLATFCGCTAIGITVVPINPLLKADEIAHILNDSQASALVLHPDTFTNGSLALEQAPAVKNVLYVCQPLKGNLPQTSRKITSLKLEPNSPAAGSAWTERVPADTPALMIYTSGTTGKPKGAVLTHSNFLWAVDTRLERFPITKEDNILCVLSMCHIYPLANIIMPGLVQGATLVVLPKFDAKRSLELIQSQRISLVPAVPTIFQMMLKECKETGPYDLSSVRCCWSGSASLPPNMITSIEQTFGAPVLEGYGLTETCGAAATIPLSGLRKPGSVGLPLKHSQLQVFDENGNVLPAGEANVGEVALKGPTVMSGYYRQAAETAAVLRDGWLFTGDLGYKDQDGYLFLVGRKKELINRGGAKIYPREVEEVILKLSGIKEVAVIGVPCEHMGERVKAVVVASDNGLTEDSVKDHCSKHLADYKVPRIIEFASSLPRNSTGKILKRLLNKA